MSKILVADDEKNIREGIATYLEDEGYLFSLLATEKKLLKQLKMKILM